MHAPTRPYLSVNARLLAHRTLVHLRESQTQFAGNRQVRIAIGSEAYDRWPVRFARAIQRPFEVLYVVDIEGGPAESVGDLVPSHDAHRGTEGLWPRKHLAIFATKLGTTLSQLDWTRQKDVTDRIKKGL